jgi:hypothetical protein
MSIRTTRRRSFAALTAVGVAAAGLTLVPGAVAPASAAVDTSLRWEISQRFDDHLSVHTFGGGASEDVDGTVSFPDAVAHRVGDTTEISYGGSVTGAFQPVPGTTAYAITIAAPTVVLDGADSKITAEVSAVVGSTTVAAPTRVVLTTFDEDAGSLTTGADHDTITATPRWAGVLPEGADSTALAIPAGQPVDGKAWDTGLLGHLPSSLRAHFYASAANQDVKAPGSFAADIVDPVPAVAVQTATTATGATVTVTGTDFTGVTNPGDNGVYVGLARAGGLPDVSSLSQQGSFVVATWVSAAALADGTFAVDLVAPADKLDPRVKYAVHTWQAHAHSNPSQDTETPVSIDWSKLGYPLATTAVVTVTKKPTSKKKGAVTIAVPGGRYAATGQVSVVYKGGKLKGTKVRLVTSLPLGPDGTVTLTLPKSARGKRTLSVTYLGDQVHRASAATAVKVKVKR